MIGHVQHATQTEDGQISTSLDQAKAVVDYIEKIWYLEGEAEEGRLEDWTPIPSVVADEYIRLWSRMTDVIQAYQDAAN